MWHYKILSRTVFRYLTTLRYPLGTRRIKIKATKWLRILCDQFTSICYEWFTCWDSSLSRNLYPLPFWNPNLSNLIMATKVVKVSKIRYLVKKLCCCSKTNDRYVTYCEIETILGLSLTSVYKIVQVLFNWWQHIFYCVW